MFNFSPENLLQRFTLALEAMIVTYNETATNITSLQAMGVKVKNIELKPAIRDHLRDTLKKICDELSQSYQGSSKNILNAEDYFCEYFTQFGGEPLSNVDFKALGGHLESDAKKLEQTGLEITAKLLINNLLGYQLDALKRTRGAYISSFDIYHYSSDTRNTVREILEQLTVAYSITGDNPSLACFDAYIDALNSVSTNDALNSRTIFGSKSDPIYITHFKTKASIHFSPVLLESVIAFATLFQPKMIESYELPQVA